MTKQKIKTELAELAFDCREISRVSAADEAEARAWIAIARQLESLLKRIDAETKK